MAQSRPTTGTMIATNDLVRTFRSRKSVVEAVRGVDLEVGVGEIFGFLGPNGAGKTTTMRLLMALLYPNAGSARIAGLDCWRRSVDVKRVVGYLPGELTLDPNVTGGQILAYFVNLRRGVDRAYLDALISRLDLDPTRRFRHYSHGNKQKVGLIQAFMHRPRLLILDEPTSGLDPLNQHEFDRMVAEVRGDGRTVLLSSHILSEVEAVCDRVAIIREGRLVRVGGVAELKNIRRHEVELTFATELSADAFKDLAGVERLEAMPDGRTLRLIVHGEIDPVLKMAARYHVITFVSHEPSLEDVFLRFYQDDGAASREDADNAAS
jgi:ABC-2 type transport system ATP-binding protein